MAGQADTTAPQLQVIAGVNGAGKSSLIGGVIREFGGDYYNPDTRARTLMAANPEMDQAEANAAAWRYGQEQLERAIAQRLDFALETTLGGNTIPRLVAEAATAGFEVRVWFVGLASPEAHIARVRQRVRQGGHDIPEADIRRRCEHSRLNLVLLLPVLTELRLFDNSTEADPAAGKVPRLVPVLHVERGRIVDPPDLSATPEWAKPIVAAALKLAR
jgi:predicted ABC-type ATPase